MPSSARFVILCALVATFGCDGTSHRHDGGADVEGDANVVEGDASSEIDASVDVDAHLDVDAAVPCATDCDDDDPCTVDVCQQTGICANVAGNEGGDCDDGDACTQSDTCSSGACVGADPVVCTSPDACHLAGSCDPGTGICSAPTDDDGAVCTVGALPGICGAGTCHPTPMVLARQDFEVTPTTPTWGFTGPVIYNQGFTTAVMTPAESPIGIGGSRAWETTTNSGGLVLAFDPVTVPTGFARVRLRFRLAAMNLQGGGGGPDNLDYVLVGVSVDGGAFYDRVRVRGALADNSTWGYDATGIASVDATPMTEAVFQPTDTGPQTSLGYSTVEVVFPGTVQSIAASITARSSSTTDTWLVDDVQLLGDYE